MPGCIGNTRQTLSVLFFVDSCSKVIFLIDCITISSFPLLGGNIHLFFFVLLFCFSLCALKCQGNEEKVILHVNIDHLSLLLLLLPASVLSLGVVGALPHLEKLKGRWESTFDKRGNQGNS